MLYYNIKSLICLHINIAYRCNTSFRLPGERDDKEMGEEVHENDEDVSHYTTGQTVQVRISNRISNRAG